MIPEEIKARRRAARLLTRMKLTRGEVFWHLVAATAFLAMLLDLASAPGVLLHLAFGGLAMWFLADIVGFLRLYPTEKQRDERMERAYREYGTRHDAR